MRVRRRLRMRMRMRVFANVCVCANVGSFVGWCAMLCSFACDVVRVCMQCCVPCCARLMANECMNACVCACACACGFVCACACIYAFVNVVCLNLRSAKFSSIDVSVSLVCKSSSKIKSLSSKVEAHLQEKLMPDTASQSPAKREMKRCLPKKSLLPPAQKPAISLT